MCSGLGTSVHGQFFILSIPSSNPTSFFLPLTTELSLEPEKDLDLVGNHSAWESD